LKPDINLVEVQYAACSTCSFTNLSPLILNQSTSINQVEGSAQLPNLPDGNYFLKVRAQDTQGNSTPPYLNTFQISSQTRNAGLIAYPNPSQEILNLKLSLFGSMFSGNCKVEVYSLNGKKLFSEIFEVSIGENDISVGASKYYAPGTYMYKVYIENNTQELEEKLSGTWIKN
ncbi:MAG: T9SS type A sorting domain-containing protein, partial [Leadbetterella sp.]